MEKLREPVELEIVIEQVMKTMNEFRYPLSMRRQVAKEILIKFDFEQDEIAKTLNKIFRYD